MENKSSFDGKRVINMDDGWKIGLGAFCFSDDNKYLLALMPDRKGKPHYVRFNISNPNESPYWQWDGNEDKPTLSPSLHWVGNWHGFLRAGRFESV